MGRIELNLDAILQDRGIDFAMLSRCLHGMSPEAVDALIRGQVSPSLEDVAKLLDALRQLTGEPVDIADVMKYDPAANGDLDRENAVWLGDESLGGDLPPYDWGPEGPPVGRPVRYEPGVGLVVVEEA